MPHAQLTETVRRLVQQAFEELGVDCPDQFQETILIRGGNYCGRRFEASTGHAIWFVEENQLKFYSASGELVCVVQPKPAAAPVRFAA